MAYLDSSGVTTLTSDIKTLADSTYLAKSGGTLTGRLTTAKPVNQILTGTGTAASTNGDIKYPAKWTFNAGFTPSDGDIITIKIPVASHSQGTFISVNNGTSYHPAACYGTSRLTTQYAVNMYITLVFDANGSAASMYPLAGATATETITGGVWRVINYYDSNTKNTAGSTNSTSKLFIIGATSQGANPQTYSCSTAYIGTDGCLYSGDAKVSTPNALSLTLASGSWSSATPSTQQVTASGVTTSNIIIVGFGSGITSAQYDAASAAKLACTAQGAGTITMTAFGTTPTENIPISVVILG